MNFSVKIAIAVFALVLVIFPAHALKCYQCASFNNTECKTNKTFSPEFLLPCKDPYGNLTQDEFYCFKASAKLQSDKDSAVYVVRGCFPALVGSLVDRCEELDNTIEFGNVKFRDTKACFCDGDGCNSAPKLQSAFAGFSWAALTCFMQFMQSA